MYLMTMLYNIVNDVMMKPIIITVNVAVEHRWSFIEISGFIKLRNYQMNVLCNILAPVL